MSVTLAIDYNVIRAKFANLIHTVTGLTAIMEEPEVQDAPRPPTPYFSFKFLIPGAKSGDDSAQYNSGTGKFNSGGVRKMTMEFNCYGNTDAKMTPKTYSHEQAYNFMALWQTALDTEGVQGELRTIGVAVWTIGNVADLSQLLNTGYEGRSHLECTFGVAMNLESDLGQMASVEVQGNVTLEDGTTVVTVDETIGPV